jgi:heme oxygenase
VENPILRAPQIRSLSPNVLPQTPQNFAVKLCVEGLALGDKFVMNKAADVEKHDEHGFR